MVEQRVTHQHPELEQEVAAGRGHGHEHLEGRVQGLEGDITEIQEETFPRLDQRVANLEGQLPPLNERLDAVATEVEMARAHEHGMLERRATQQEQALNRHATEDAHHGHTLRPIVRTLFPSLRIRRGAGAIAGGIVAAGLLAAGIGFAGYEVGNRKDGQSIPIGTPTPRPEGAAGIPPVTGGVQPKTEGQAPAGQSPSQEVAGSTNTEIKPNQVQAQKPEYIGIRYDPQKGCIPIRKDNPNSQQVDPHETHPLFYDGTGPGKTKIFSFTLNPDQIAVVSGWSVDNQSNGVYKAYKPVDGQNTTYNVLVTDGSISIVPRTQGVQEFCLRVNMAIANGWAHSVVTPLSSWQTN